MVPTCNRVILYQWSHCVNPIRRPSLTIGFDKHTSACCSFRARALYSLTLDDVFVQEVLQRSRTELKSDHIFIELFVVRYTWPSLIA